MKRVLKRNSFWVPNEALVVACLPPFIVSRLAAITLPDDMKFEFQLIKLWWHSLTALHRRRRHEQQTPRKAAQVNHKYFTFHKSQEKFPSISCWFHISSES